GRRADAETAALPEQLRLARVGGPRALHLRAEDEPRRQARLPDRHLQARRRPLFGHRRLRLSRQGGALRAGALLLRGLLHGRDLEPPRRARQAREQAQGAAQGRLALVVRPGRCGRAVCDLARRPGLQADALMRLRLLLAIGAVLALTACGSSQQQSPSASASRVGGNWTRFGYDAARSNSGPART